VTAAIVGARLTGSLRGKDRPMAGHVIVAGLGNGRALAEDLRIIVRLYDDDLAERVQKTIGRGAGARAAQARGSTGLDWSPPPDHRLVPQDRLFVLATREGLSRVLTRSRPR
jgi:hypothetical protein